MNTHPQPGRSPRESAFTLTELLVAATIALVVMGALASLLGTFSRAGTNSQSIVDMSSRMRSAANRLRQDLGGLTAPLTPPLSPEAGLGYFEIVEGPIQDGLATTAAGTLMLQSGTATWATGTTSILADVDDALLFTTRSLSGPFEGRYGAAQVESNTAEVAWFCRPSATQPFPGVQLQTLYRRQLLVVGYVGASPFFQNGSATNNQITDTLPNAYGTYDVSLRLDPSVNALVPNTLADLTQRENRFFHGPTWSTPFPNAVVGLTFDGTPREGEDIVLTNVIAFDVRVYDPEARPKLALSGSLPVYPNDQGYALLGTGSAVAAPFTGAFVDLGGNSRSLAPTAASNTAVLVSGSLTFAGTSLLSGTVNGRSGLPQFTLATAATYDTWSTFYESNGIDDDSVSGVDQGTNGIDDNANGIPDDSPEKETFPPYPTPLKAVEIRIRCIDPTSREIRQLTVRQAFSN